jgi:transcriptional regulator with XRE-family HTH domain
MMKQPDLGKKIAELRKAKGLTQDELVEKCNINVRTLQRIESGEVTPRSYTVKIIFAELDYKIYDSSKSLTNKFIHTELIINKWLGQFYKYVIDLFNLETHTMKKLVILSTPVLAICIVLIFSISSSAKSHSRMAIREKFEQTSSNPTFMRLFNSGQIDSISIRYLENACMMADNAPTTYDRKSINEHFMQLFNRGLRFSKLTSSFKVISDSLAIDRGEWDVSVNAIVVASGTYLSQWRYIDGKWWIENEMSKSDAVNNP